MIYVDKLPTTSGSSFVRIQPGIYKAKVTKADWVVPEKAEQKSYLRVTLAVLDKKGKEIGLVQDKLFESDKQAVMYKIGRFITALELVLTGGIELKDLAKIVVNRTCVVELEDNTYTNNRTGKEVTQTQVKMFDTEIYWPTAEYKNLVEADEDMVEFDAEDGDVPADIPFPVDTDAPSDDEY
jgi:hypothetical protein